MSRDKDREYLRCMVDFCEKILHVRETSFPDETSFAEREVERDAVTFYVFQLGEYAGRISEELREQHEEIPWRSVRGVRNILAHAYGSVDVQMLWEIITEDVPVLKAQCEALLGE